jgi:hypothetical protein
MRVEVDLEYPKELRDFHNQYPLILCVNVKKSTAVAVKTRSLKKDAR